MPGRRLVVLGLATVAGGCGFQPLYGRNAREFDRALAGVTVDAIPERLGQLTANALRDSFNPGGARVEQRYRLRVNLTTSRGDFAIRPDGTASRQLYSVTAGWELLPLVASATSTSGVARFNTSYDIGDNAYAVIVAGQDAEQRAARELTQQIRDQLILYLRRQPATS